MRLTRNTRRRNQFSKDLLSLEYIPDKRNKRLKVLNKTFDLIDISRLTKIPLVKLKKSYSNGLVLLNNLVSAYNIFMEHDDENINPYIQENNIESLWSKDCKYYTYIPYMGIEEYALLHKYNPKLIELLKPANKVKEIDNGR